MLYFLITCIRNFGLINGLSVYLEMKLLKTGRVTLHGLAYPLYYRKNSVDQHTFREIFLRREYDIKGKLDFKPKVIVDAGANIGFTTLFFLLEFNPSLIISLEPDSRNFALLQKNTQHYPSITPVQKALWHKERLVEISDEGYGLRGFVVKSVQANSDEEVVNSGNASNMKGTTVQSLMKQHKLTHIDILKMDIEGSEKEVFSEGSEEWLPITRCLIIELHDRMKEGCSQAVFLALANYNFEFAIKGENLIFINRNFKG
jgi:FkbM family methyltransferase